MKLSDIDLGDVLMFTWTVQQAILVVIYGWRSRWFRSLAGRVLLISFTCTMIALTQVSVTLLTDSGYWARDIIRPIAYALGNLGTTVLIVLVLLMQRKDP